MIVVYQLAYKVVVLPMATVSYEDMVQSQVVSLSSGMPQTSQL